MNKFIVDNTRMFATIDLHDTAGNNIHTRPVAPGSSEKLLNLLLNKIKQLQKLKKCFKIKLTSCSLLTK